MRLGVIRVITTEDPHVLNSHGEILAHELGIEVISRCLPNQPEGVYDGPTFDAAAEKTVTLAHQMAKHDSVDALLVSCAADPGVPEAAQSLHIPVIGAGSAAAWRAAALGQQVGVLDLTPQTPHAVTAVLANRYMGARVPAKVSRSADLQHPKSAENAVAAAHELLDGGADVIMFACTGMTTINLATSLEARLAVPIVDAVRAGGQAALAAGGSP